MVCWTTTRSSDIALLLLLLLLQSLLPPLNFAKWVEDHAAELTPPVGNKLLYGDGEFKVMVVGGTCRAPPHVAP